ncbi:hydrogenobyrinate a,c-diamide synthase [Sphingobium sp. TA15]|uniref:Cobyrinate a,c-diamide synthase n=1 Tax=Sphingobium indicum (strain DSM 16413 / CCM 7287 / MTCC 6362 / UT26 / NBRC 101211 / UT26S) TaxID=452662 RepID=D4Z862_SPHIU|nr:cobyrinate a,c-diamide synthase [Sphingobium indicum]BAI98681.1 cobyrinic acid a,c-diamide synthase [Sphingobium indicum UT26S]BDD68729.1 hydrogenobyrinate a,c-diamide synthase [Sphingobium sp. TA15]
MTPGLLIAAPRSGSGKTTVTLGLLRAFSRLGVRVQPFKSGPDYIDPAFQQAASRRPSFNLDSWAMSAPQMAAIAGRADAELIVAEGVMGLFDGAPAIGEAGTGASADIAALFGWPVLLVMDVSGQSQSAAAIASGFRDLRSDISMAGAVLNHVASQRHERLIRAAMEEAGIPVLGAIPRSAALRLPERHLGLVQAAEQADLDQIVDCMADIVATYVDLNAIRRAARFATPQNHAAMPILSPPGQRIAIARDEAFSFTYAHLLSGWRDAGAEILPFSPLADEAPAADADAVWLPGGYPELHAGRIAQAARFLSGLRRHALDRPIHGECGGYMVLGEALIDADGQAHAMAGLLGLVTSFAERRLHLGYRRARLLAPMGGMPAGAMLNGHEFHYSTIVEQPDSPLAHVTDAEGQAVPSTGSHRGRVTGSFFHLIAPSSKASS